MKRLLLTSIVAFVCAVGFAQKVTIDGITYKLKDDMTAYVYAADENLERVVIPSCVSYNGQEYKVTAIGHSKGFLTRPFISHKNLTSVSIPNSVTTIYGEAFHKCSNLKELIVPDYPIEINKGAPSFKGCTALTTVKCQNGTIPYWIIDKLPGNTPFVMQHPLSVVPSQVVYVSASQNPQPQPVQPVPQPAQKTPSSDVDVNLPSNATNNDKTFAVIFANENYAEEVNVEYALNDGEVFKEYCHKVLGLPEENVHIRKDATLNNIKAEVSWMQQVAKAYNGQARFIVFYAGHGIPDEASKAAYLLPVDGKGSMLDTGYSLAKLYEQLGNMPAERVTVFMDACFSGSKRGEGMLASARGVAIKAKPQAPKGKMVVFSAASGDETAYPLKDKEHGLFTYYLLKKLKDTNGDVTYGELGSYITEQVSRKSIVSNGKSQSPTVTPSQSVASTWKTMKLKGKL